MKSGRFDHRTLPAATTVARDPSRQSGLFESLEDRRLFAAVTPVADSFVRDGSFTATNFGAANALFSKNTAGDTREALLKFDVSSAGTIGTAILRFDARLQNGSTPDTRVGIFGLSNTGWIEGNGTTSNAAGDGTDTDNNPAGEVTFNNRPPSIGQAIDIITISGNAQQSYAFDVTRFVKSESDAGRPVVGFVIRNLDAGADWVSYVAREGGEFGPLLDVTAESGPTTSFTANNAPQPGFSTHTVNVTYNDPDDVELLSISPDDITVTSPSGEALNVTGFTASPNASAAQIVVTYTVAGPGGSFDSGDAGTYTVRLNAGQVSDTFENAAPPGHLGQFTIGSGQQGDTTPPSASLVSVPAVTNGAPTLSFVVRYQDNNGVDVATFSTTDLVVLRGEDPALTVLSVTPNEIGGDIRQRTVTYTVEAPGGSWDGADDGIYTINLLPNQIGDVSGNAAPGRPLGQFEVALVSGPGDPRELIGDFGTPSGGGRPVSLTFADADGTSVTLGLKGGAGQAFRRGDVIDLDLAGTTGLSALSIKARGGDGRVRLGDVSGAGLKNLGGKAVDLVGGDIVLTGPLGKLQLGNVVDSSLTVGAGGLLSLQLGAVNNFTIESASPIKSMKLASWTDDGTVDGILAPSIGSVTSAGGFAADIITGFLKSLKVGGALSASTIRGSALGKITATGLVSSQILAGVRGDVVGLPDGADDFDNPNATLTGVTNRGTFSNSVIAAPLIGKVAAGSIEVANGGTVHGITGGQITGITGAAAGSAVKLSRLDDPSESTGVQDFAVRVL